MSADITSALASIGYSVAKTVLKSLTETFMSPIVGDGNPRLLAPEKRISFGVGKKNGNRSLVLIVEKEGGKAEEDARDLKKQHPGEFRICTIGKAYSSKSSVPLKQDSVGVLAPGCSVGHYRGFAGSLCAFVRAKRSNGDWTGAIGSAHVLTVNNTADKGDAVLQPGHPDAPRVLENRIGKIDNFTFLVHHSDKGDPTNTEDVALVRLDPHVALPAFNKVPDPKDPAKSFQLQNECYPSKDFFNLVAETVYKVGRTTGFTSGILELVGVQLFPIELPNGRTYIYSNIVAVKHVGKSRFSEPGDSGALVYTKEGKAIGLVVGGNDEYTIVSPLDICLKAMKVELL